MTKNALSGAATRKSVGTAREKRLQKPSKSEKETLPVTAEEESGKGMAEHGLHHDGKHGAAFRPLKGTERSLLRQVPAGNSFHDPVILSRLSLFL